MGTNRIKEINHKLDLLLQKFEIDPTFDCWDDGKRYLVVMEHAPDYLPKDYKGRYVAMGGTIGECRQYLKSRRRNDMIIIRAGE